MCSPLPIWSGNGFGAKDAANPSWAVQARTVSRTLRKSSAAPTASLALTETSSCPGPYSLIACSTAIPCASRASVIRSISGA
jgi:hypothetical protein